MRLYHDSRSLDCRAPEGAVCVNTPVRLRLYGADECCKARLIFIVNGKRTEYDMLPIGFGGYEARVNMPQKPSLCWYFFYVENAKGAGVYYGAPHDGLGGVGEESCPEPRAFQITVYDTGYKTPEYLRSGVMYQIFPDRFSRSKMPETQRKDAYVHEQWNERPLVKVDGLSGDNFALDFFGGDLNGIAAHMAELADLGVTVLYLNPIFQARTNHRYDTADYQKIDPFLGSEKDFENLCETARKYSVHVLLDGVFSHTGDDSVYFNKYGRYPSVGACQSVASRYYPWYKFLHYPDDYACWWGFRTLPEVDKNNDDYRRFIMGHDGVAKKWLRSGASGWRLDVADELPMSFLRQLRRSVRDEKKDAALLGEVWEDASHKLAYGETRCYCLGDTLDSVMNYPLRDACISFLLGKSDAGALCRLILSQRENYAPPFYYSLMNLMGSHDRARIISVLGGSLKRDDERGDSREPVLSESQYALGKKRLLTFLQILVSLPGIPCIYYGDECGMQGAADPFCRGTYPWGTEDKKLRNDVKSLLALRRMRVLQTGTLDVRADGPDTIVIKREITSQHDVFGAPAQNEAYEIRIHR